MCAGNKERARGEKGEMLNIANRTMGVVIIYRVKRGEEYKL
jgi:hypothetical protein